VAIEDGDQFVVIDVPQSAPDMGFAQVAEMGEQLAKSNGGRQIPNFRQRG
jgi:hypothetical protein